MSDTRNVKLGVCKAYFDGVDLGYTKGGVEVSVTTETHKVEIDQFGKSAINESIMGRELKIKVPMAETTIENMVKIMPGATLVQTGGTKASGTLTYVSNPSADNNIVVGGTTVTLKSSNPVAANNEVLLGATLAETLTNLRDFINASTDLNLAKVTTSATGTVLTITYNEYSTDGNSYTLSVGTSGGTASGATLTGGVASTKKRVDVTSGVGNDLLSIAKELRLHPKGLADNDKSEDFIVPLAATAGALTFAYKLDEERVYNVEFMGYPDINNSDKMFSVGDPTAA